MDAEGAKISSKSMAGGLQWTSMTNRDQENRKNIFREPRDEPLVATILRKFLRNPRRTVRAPAGSSSLGMNGVYFEPGSTSALPTSMTVRRLADASGGLNQFFSLTGEATPFKFARD